jgi:hypothetical protein
VNILQPKKAIQTRDELKREFSTVVQSGNFHEVMTHALAQFVLNNTPDAGQLHAVRIFISTLMHMHEVDEEPKTFPTKTLDHTIYNPHSQ